MCGDRVPIGSLASSTCNNTSLESITLYNSFYINTYLNQMCKDIVYKLVASVSEKNKNLNFNSLSLSMKEDILNGITFGPCC